MATTKPVAPVLLVQQMHSLTQTAESVHFFIIRPLKTPELR